MISYPGEITTVRARFDIPGRFRRLTMRPMDCIQKWVMPEAANPANRPLADVASAIGRERVVEMKREARVAWARGTGRI